MNSDIHRSLAASSLERVGAFPCGIEELRYTQKPCSVVLGNVWAPLPVRHWIGGAGAFIGDRSAGDYETVEKHQRITGELKV